MIDIIFKGFPFPPSVNNYLMPVMGKVKRGRHGRLYASGRMVKTDQHKQYESDCTYWELKHKNGLSKLKAEIQERRAKVESEGLVFAIRVDFYLMINRAQLLVDGNKPFRMDADNYQKPCQDNLFRILGIDDRYAFKTSIEKVASSGPNNVIINISEYILKTQQDIHATLGI